MSTSLLYHAFGLRGYKYVAMRVERGEIIFFAEHMAGTLSCPECGSANVIRRGVKPRRFMAPDIGMKPVNFKSGKSEDIRILASIAMIIKAFILRHLISRDTNL